MTTQELESINKKFIDKLIEEGYLEIKEGYSFREVQEAIYQYCIDNKILEKESEND